MLIGEVTLKHSNEFKFDVVRLLLEKGLSQAEVADRLGITSNSISAWVRAYKKDQKDILPGKDHQTPEQERIRQLEKENRELRIGCNTLRTTPSIQRLVIWARPTMKQEYL